MLWEIDIYPAPGQPDRLGMEVATNAAELGIASGLKGASATGYLIQGPLEHAQVERLARELFADGVIERSVMGQIDAPVLSQPPSAGRDACPCTSQAGRDGSRGAKRAIGDCGFRFFGRCRADAAEILAFESSGGKTAALGR